MALPTFDQFFLPILKILASEGAPVRKATLYAQVAVHANLTPADMAVELDSGQLTYQNRIGWACTWLKFANLVTSPTRPFWTATPHGRARLANPSAITITELRQFTRGHNPSGTGSGANPEGMDSETPPPTATPEEQIAAGVLEIERALHDELTQRLTSGSPQFLEQTALKLLKAMGYAGERGRIETTGGTGDHGIDGIVYCDPFGFERVYVQAKRWGNAVGPQTVREFIGAMDNRAAVKGVIVATGTFTASARKEAQRSQKVVILIDGSDLAALMVKFGVGVNRDHHVVLPRLDGDFFDE